MFSALRTFSFNLVIYLQKTNLLMECHIVSVLFQVWKNIQLSERATKFLKHLNIWIWHRRRNMFRVKHTQSTARAQSRIRRIISWIVSVYIWCISNVKMNTPGGLKDRVFKCMEQENMVNMTINYRNIIIFNAINIHLTLNLSFLRSSLGCRPFFPIAFAFPPWFFSE